VTGTQVNLPALFDLTGSVAIVTGGTRGIGRRVAEGLAEAGASVVVASRKPDACAQTAAELTEQGYTALGVPTHVGDPSSVAALVEATVEAFGRIDIVFNNAATALAAPLESVDAGILAKSFEVNAFGPLLLAQAALPWLTRSDHAAVVNVISSGAFTWAPSTSVYVAAKSALLSFTRNMAAEWAGLGVRVNALSPGPVDTDMTRAAGPEMFELMKGANLQQRVADAAEMVGPALFLCSRASSYVTGQVLVADGGMAVAR